MAPKTHPQLQGQGLFGRYAGSERSEARSPEKDGRGRRAGSVRLLYSPWKKHQGLEWI